MNFFGFNRIKRNQRETKGIMKLHIMFFHHRYIRSYKFSLGLQRKIIKKI